jgi:retron-type reverse transcriptase
MVTAKGGAPRDKWYSLYDKVIAPLNLRLSFDLVKANRGAAGMDGESIEAYEERLDERLRSLAEMLRTKTYAPQPVRRVYIPKPDGSQRPLGIPTVEDRLVQQALRRVIEPIYEAEFLPCSF